VAAVAALGWLLALAVLSLIATVTALIAWVQTHWLLCLLGALALLVLLTATGGDRRAGCGGLHCRGCHL
jgi:1,4-dihydroxy-2-naphthoate octaprenyltransferase